MSVMEKVKVKKSYAVGFKKILGKIVWALLSFVMSFSGVLTGGCPFAISLISVSSKSNFLLSAVGAGLGYMLFSSGNNALRYFSAVIIATLGAFAINIFNLKKEPYVPMTIAFLSVFATGVVMNFKTGALPAQYGVAFGEAVLAMGGAYFFFNAVNCNIKRLKFKALPVSDLTCVMIFASVVLSGFSFIKLGSICPARIIGVLFILTAVRFGSQRWGMIVALCLGFAFGISEENSLFLLGAYAFSALVSSLFVNMSSLSVGVSFTLSMAFFAVASSGSEFNAFCIFESAIASLVLVLLPEPVCQKLNELWQSGADIAPDGSLRQSLVVRLRFASSALAQVSQSVRDVREKINTLKTVEPMESEIRMVASDQFFSISDMLADLAFEFDGAEIFDFKSAGRIRRLMGEYDIYPENISVIVDKFDRMRIEIVAPLNTQGLSNPRIRQEIEKICHRDFEKGRINNVAPNSMLTFIEKPNFKMSIGYSQYCAEGKLCGDTIKTINDSRGHMVLIISDGMGKGSRAALDGAMGAGLLSKLLCAGFGFDSSLKVVNSALLVKSSEESLATLDCASIDLFTGKCEFYKAGAPRSYIIKGDSVTKCELSSMPAGILRGIEFAKRTTVLNVDDEIIMMSDGITDIGDDWLEGFLKLDDSQTPSEKAKAILDFAVKNSNDRHRDDMSVIVARLMRN